MLKYLVLIGVIKNNEVSIKTIALGGLTFLLLLLLLLGLVLFFDVVLGFFVCFFVYLGFFPLKTKKLSPGSLAALHLRKTTIHCDIILLLITPWGCRYVVFCFHLFVTEVLWIIVSWLGDQQSVHNIWSSGYEVFRKLRIYFLGCQSTCKYSSHVLTQRPTAVWYCPSCLSCLFPLSALYPSWQRYLNTSAV